MKKLIGISLIIFWTAVIAIAILGLGRNAPVSNISPGGGVPTTTIQNLGQITLNLKEVAKHNSENSCWMIIGNKIYDVTSYLPIHPGGVQSMLPYCGQDATQAFNTKGGKGGPHSSYADNLLAAYLVGDLNQIINKQQLQKNNATSSNSNNLVIPKNYGDEGGD